jgi:myo-inositol-1(or 4)-monophosphatase
MRASDPEHQSLEALERAACEAAWLGGEVLLRRFRSGGLRVEQKGLHDFVTEVDREAEAVVTAYIRRHFPEHSILAEESAGDSRTAAYRWVVDPLDGTTNFIHGVGTFAVSVAVEDSDGPVAGVVHDPLHAETFHARRGGGAKRNGAPMSCSAPAGLDSALLATGFPFREMRRVEPYLESLEAFVRSTAGLRRAGSAALDLAYVACGRYDGFWEVGLSRWDIAAGVLLVLEAGGAVSDVTGAATHLETGDIVAAGKTIHAAMVEVTRRYLSS